ncbi:MAG: hypothetical protein ACP5QH_07205 [Thermoplasmata archaeon]|jgi:hypothetical protein
MKEKPRNRQWIYIFDIPYENANEFLLERVGMYSREMKIVKPKKIATRILKERGYNSKRFVNEKEYNSLVKSIAYVLRQMEKKGKIENDEVY